jgi:hypothetical protein
MSVKIVLANKSNKQALQEWEELLQSMRDSTPIDVNETGDEKIKRMAELEKPGNEEEWFRYYFPKFYSSKPAKFHILSTKTFLSLKRIFQVRKWFRGSSKSTRRMMEVMYKKFVHKLRVNLLLISKTETNAVRLLSVYRATLEANQRLINDYGVQKRHGKWAEHEFITRDKCSFRAVGMEQNPRGAKLDELRINVLIFDDADDDEVCRNEDRLNEQWKWIERAAIPTIDISSEYYICFDNNVIAEDCLVLRASEKATHQETINIRDESGKSSWREKNSEKDIDDAEALISYESAQQEFYNNPMNEGKTFPDVKFGKCPLLRKLPVVIMYADPATSNKDKPSLKSKALNSCKAVVLLGCKDFNYYVYKVWCNHSSNAHFIDWIYSCRDYVNGQSSMRPFIENNTLQDPFFQQVLKPLLRQRAKELKKIPISLIPDERKKPEKWTRIEGTLEPLNRNGKLIFNEDEKEDPHMKRLVAQLKGAKATSKILDGPDCLEGAVVKMQEHLSLLLAGKQMESVEIENSKKY